MPNVGSWRERLNLVFGVDLRALAVFRIGAGLLLLHDLWSRAQFLEEHYTDFGILPVSQLSGLLRGSWYLSLHSLSGEYWWQATLFAIAAVAAILLTIGWHTRLASIVSWALLVSLHNRNTLVIHCGDALLRDLLFWALFLPLGAVWSLDARRRPVEARSTPTRIVSVASAALLGQMFALYFFSGFMKSGPLWQQGTALFYALELDAFVSPVGHWLREYREILPWLTFSALYAERIAPWFIWSPWLHTPLRLLFVGLFGGFHLALIVVMTLGIFPYVCLLGLIPLLPTAFWDRLAPRKPVDESTVAEPPAVPAEGSVRNRRWLTIAANTLVGALIAVALYWNVMLTFPQRVTTRPRAAFEAVVDFCRLEQNWCMFAPNPAQHDGWFVATGRLADGRRVDLLNPGRALSDDKPDLQRDFPYWRWRLYFFFIAPPDYPPAYDPLAHWLVRRWNRDHARSPQDVCKHVELKYWLEPTSDGREPASWVEQRLLDVDL